MFFIEGEASFPKLVLEFAEFLKYYSLNRLSIFNYPTCVGLQYGLKLFKKLGFSQNLAFLFVVRCQNSYLFSTDEISVC